MFESVMTFDLQPGIDMNAYQAWVNSTLTSLSQQEGMLGFRANRNMLGSPMSRSVTTWRTLEDWARYDSGAWKALAPEFRRYATNIKVELWGPSPIVQQPISASL